VSDDEVDTAARTMVSASRPVSAWLRFRILADRAAAVALATLSAPVVAVIGWLVHRHDGGPAFIRVPRSGRGGREFGMWKIRSMRVDHGDGRASGASLTSSDDDRITPIGRRIRKLHLDELPQLWNVVRGEMCILGPRPEAPPYVDRSDPGWQAVLRVPPGIAGPTQLVVGDWELQSIDADTTGDAYRLDVLPVKLAIDNWYVERSSALLDLGVLVTLVRHVVLRDDGAWLDGRVRREVPAARVALDDAAGPTDV
jgi:lipopolysaccharide/colanic/teichoic acid biosynthesis glycosyltransferase